MLQQRVALHLISAHSIQCNTLHSDKQITVYCSPIDEIQHSRSAQNTEQDKIDDFSDTPHFSIVHCCTEELLAVQSKYCALLLILFDQF